MLKNLRFKWWWIVKSPWTKRFGIFSVLKLIFKAWLSPKVKINNISICLAAANRQEMLNTVFLPSLLNLSKLENMEIVVSCFENEVQEHQLLFEKMGLKSAKVIGVAGKFQRAKFLNQALNEAAHDSVFLTDVDIALPNNFFSLYEKNVNKNQAWFPICTLRDKDGLAFAELPEGTGLVGFIRRPRLLLNEGFEQWGNEDWEFLFQLFENNYYPKRTRKDGFMHHWHKEESKEGYEQKW